MEMGMYITVDTDQTAPTMGSDVEAAAAFDDLTRNNEDDELVRQVKQAWPNVFRTARYVPAVE